MNSLDFFGILGIQVIEQAQSTQAISVHFLILTLPQPRRETSILSSGQFQIISSLGKEILKVTEYIKGKFSLMSQYNFRRSGVLGALV